MTAGTPASWSSFSLPARTSAQPIQPSSRAVISLTRTRNVTPQGAVTSSSSPVAGNLLTTVTADLTWSAEGGSALAPLRLMIVDISFLQLRCDFELLCPCKPLDPHLLSKCCAPVGRSPRCDQPYRAPCSRIPCTTRAPVVLRDPPLQVSGHACVHRAVAALDHINEPSSRSARCVLLYAIWCRAIHIIGNFVSHGRHLALRQSILDTFLGRLFIAPFRRGVRTSA